MNDAWGYDETAEQPESGHNDGPKALRDAYNKLKDKYETEVSSLNEKLTSFINEQNKGKVSAVFSELGVPGAADLYQGEPDPEKARAWAESMRAAFGSGAQGTPAPSSPPAPTLDASTQQQFQQMTEAGQTGTPLGNFEAAGAAVSQANDLNALIAAMNQANHLNG